MRRFRRSLAVIGILMGAGCFTAAVAQQASRGSQEKNQPKNAPKLTLGDSDGTPGGSVVVPIYLAPAEGVELGQIKFDVSFVSKNLKYSNVKKGMAAESGNVEIHAELKEEKNDKGLETSMLSIVASIPQPKPGQKGIPAGLLGYITFKVNEGAGPANITLHTTAEAAELGTRKPIPNLKTADAQVDVLAAGSEPLYSCFFFSH